MADIKQKIDIADKRTEVLKNIYELKRHILPHLHTNYLDARKDLTSIIKMILVFLMLSCFIIILNAVPG